MCDAVLLQWTMIILNMGLSYVATTYIRRLNIHNSMQNKMLRHWLSQ